MKKIFLIAGLLLGWVLTGYGQLTEALVKDRICEKWVLVETVEHHSEEPIPGATSNVHEIEFFPDGSFYQRLGGNEMGGNWKFDEGGSRLFMTVTSYNGKAVAEKAMRTYEWILVKADDGSLEWVKQNRDRLVREIFRKQG